MFTIRSHYEVDEMSMNQPCILAGSFSSDSNARCRVYARRNALIPLNDIDRVNEVYTALGIEPEE